MLRIAMWRLTQWTVPVVALGALALTSGAVGQERGLVRPDPPHTHRFPVTVYILEGAFTLEMEGRAPVTIKAGQAMVEPPNVKMTGDNRSATDPIRLVIFYVSDPDTPFLDPVQ